MSEHHDLVAQQDTRFADMVWIPGETFLMGSDNFYPEEKPVHRVRLDGFWMDVFDVTNAQFSLFVEATGYVTVAERPLNPDDYPDADPALLVPGSLVFRKTKGPVDLRDYRNWWEYVPGACWRTPEGPESCLVGRDNNPVVHVAYEDAETYARWVHKELLPKRSGSMPLGADWKKQSSPGGTSFPLAGS